MTLSDKKTEEISTPIRIEFNRGAEFWEHLEDKHEGYKKLLKQIVINQNILSALYSRIMKNKTKVRLLMVDSVRRAKVITSEINSLSNNLKRAKDKWKELGNDEDLFYLNVTANNYAERLDELLKLREEYVVRYPKEILANYNDLDIRFLECKRDIKKTKEDFKRTQRSLDNNLKEEHIISINTEATSFKKHPCTIVISVVVIQLMIRRRNYRILNQETYIKNSKHEWFKCTKKGDLIQCSEDRSNHLNQKVNRKLK